VPHDPGGLISLVDSDGKPTRDEREPLRMLLHEQNPQFAVRARQRIEAVLRDPRGLPDGKRKRTRLAPPAAKTLSDALFEAAEHALVWAANCTSLPNRAPARGRPPDNTVLIFIDDIVHACRAVGLKPGLRYVDGSESLPVRIFNELAPMIWPIGANPRRLFERWQRHRDGLIRTG
jgi:hypothetical protein